MTDDDQPEGTYRLTLEGQGLSFQQEITADRLAAIMAIALGVTPAAAPSARNPNLGATEVPQGMGAQGRVSLREFLDDVAASRIPEKILAIGGYLERQESQSLFTRDDVKTRFRSAGEPQPGNFPRDFSVAISSGWIAEDHANRGSFYVTKKGHQVIDSSFSADVSKMQRRSARKRRSGRNAEGPAD
jgi:hypothetical protein